MTRALIVSTARTGRAAPRWLQRTRKSAALTHMVSMAATHHSEHSPLTAGGHAIKSAIERAGIEPGAVEDVILGCGMPEAETGMNIARNAAMWAGCPVTTSGTTVNRFCSSGLQAVAMAAQAILVDGTPCAIGGGLDSISLVQPKALGKGVVVEKKLMKEWPALWMPMIDTADLVAKRYGVSREAQDAYALRSQQRTAAAQAAGLFDAEIVPMETVMAVKDKATGEVTKHDYTVTKDRYTVTKDECNRPSTDLASLEKLAPVRADADAAATVTAGNASQLSDGASACVLMSEI